MRSLETLLQRLIRADVEFVIIGGYAVVAHGASLLTQDLDVCCRFAPENLMRLQKALSNLHPVHRMTPKRIPLKLTPASCRRLKSLYLDTDEGPLDCLSDVKGVGGFDEAAAHSLTVDLGFGSCRILALEDLIKAKEAMGRPRDLEAVAQLSAIRRQVSTPAPRKRNR